MMLINKILFVCAENKMVLGNTSLTIFASFMANLEAIGDMAKSISAIIAVIVGVLTGIKLIKDIFFTKKKSK